RLQVAFEVPVDLLQSSLPPTPLRTGEIMLEASLKSVPSRIVGSFFFQRWVRSKGHLGSKDLRCRPRPFDIRLFEGEATIGAVELVLVDEPLAAAASYADTKARKRIIEGNNFGPIVWHLKRRNSSISQLHLGSSRWEARESGKMNSGLWEAYVRVK